MSDNQANTTNQSSSNPMTDFYVNAWAQLFSNQAMWLVAPISMMMKPYIK